MSTRPNALGRVARPAIGLVISGVFIAATLSRVEPDLVGKVMADVAMGPVAIAVAVSSAEVALRALRWLVLLRALVATRYRFALGWLAVGHLANALLPARLGDLARALFAGASSGSSRASILGTIAVERVTDAALLAAVATLGVLFGGHAALGPVVLFIAFGAAAAGLLVGLLTFTFRARAVAGSRIGRVVGRYAARFAAGAAALRHPPKAAAVAVLTLGAFGLTTGVMLLVAGGVGLSLSIGQAALVVAAITLSTAIPAGPASLGTYEFVGVAVLGTMGFAAEESLVAIFLVHLVVTVPPAVMGVVAMWAMGIRHLVPGSDARVSGATAGHLP